MEDSHVSINLTAEYLKGRAGHPWLSAEELRELPGAVDTPVSATVQSVEGQLLGSGVYDPSDPVAAWRRFSWQAGAIFDASYVAVAINEALARRSDEACQRLIASDADYLPGLTVDIYGQVLRVQADTRAMAAQLEAICEVFSELVAPREIVIVYEGAVRTLSGQNLKGFWVEVDGVEYRIDLLNPLKPLFYLDQREQHALVGSLCTGRRVLDGFSGQGGFAMQAARAEAAEVIAVDLSEDAVKTLGATAQKNGLSVQAQAADLAEYLTGTEAGAFDAVILDPPAGFALLDLEALLEDAFRVLGQGGLLAVYQRGSGETMESFEQAVSRAAALQGREGRVFARTGQPFDFPTLLSLPESSALRGLILQVE